MIIYTKSTFKKRKKMTAKQKADRAVTDALNKKYAVDHNKLNNTPSKRYILEIPADRNVTQHIKSHGPTCGDTAKIPSPVYTGNAIVGIATMHKSNLVPVFSQQEAEDTAKMRR